MSPGLCISSIDQSPPSITTLPAVLHHYGLFILLTPPTLPGEIICFTVFLKSFCSLLVKDTSTVLRSVVSHSVFCCVFCLLAFLFILNTLVV